MPSTTPAPPPPATPPFHVQLQRDLDVAAKRGDAALAAAREGLERLRALDRGSVRIVPRQ